MQHIYRINPTSIEDLNIVVEDFIDLEIINRACSSTRQRFRCSEWKMGEG
jgi:DNA replication protein DnaD